MIHNTLQCCCTSFSGRHPLFFVLNHHHRHHFHLHHPSFYSFPSSLAHPYVPASQPLFSPLPASSLISNFMDLLNYHPLSGYNHKSGEERARQLIKFDRHKWRIIHKTLFHPCLRVKPKPNRNPTPNRSHAVNSCHPQGPSPEYYMNWNTHTLFQQSLKITINALPITTNHKSTKVKAAGLSFEKNQPFITACRRHDGTTAPPHTQSTDTQQ